MACLGPPLSGQSEHARRPGAGVRAALRRQQAEGNRPEPELPYEWVVAVGSLSLRLWRHIVDFTGLVGQLILDIVLVARAPREGPWRETSANLYKSGVRAMPVTALVGFLIGIVLSYLSALQLKNSAPTSSS